MRWFRFALLILFVAVLQASVLANMDVRPDLLLILLVFFAIYCNATEAIITSFAIGFAADLIGSPIPMGPQMLSFGIFGTLLAYLHRVIAIRKMPFQALAIFATTLLAGTFAHFLAFLIKSEPLTLSIFRTLFWMAIYSAIVGPFLFLPSAWWMRIRINRFTRH